MQNEFITLSIREQTDGILKLVNQLPDEVLSQKQKTLIRTTLCPDKTVMRIQSAMSVLSYALEHYSNNPNKNPVCVSTLLMCLEKAKLAQFMVIGQTSLILSELKIKAAELEVMRAADTTDIGNQTRHAINLLYDMHVAGAVKAKAITDILLLLCDLQKAHPNDISVLTDIETMTELVCQANGLTAMVL